MKVKIDRCALQLHNIASFAPDRFSMVGDGGRVYGWFRLSEYGHWVHDCGVVYPVDDDVASLAVDEIARHPDWVKELSRHKQYLLGAIQRELHRNQVWVDRYTSGLEYLEKETRF